MSLSLHPLHARLVSSYLQAKDEQRPHLFRTVFAHDAVFQSRFTFDTDFADEDEHHGAVAIAEVFKRLGATCENIYTVCFDDTVVVDDVTAFSCGWAVVMQERQSGRMRLAVGTYDWQVDAAAAVARRLDVVMTHMQEVDAAVNDHVLDGMHRLLSSTTAPWCDRPSFAKAMANAGVDLHDVVAGLSQTPSVPCEKVAS